MKLHNIFALESSIAVFGFADGKRHTDTIVSLFRKAETLKALKLQAIFPSVYFCVRKNFKQSLTKNKTSDSHPRCPLGRTLPEQKQLCF